MGYPEYLFKASVAVLFSWLLYRICFRRFTFYQWNRVYLVASLTVSLLLPLVRLPRVRTPFSVPEFGEFTLDLFALHVADGPVMLSGNPDPGAGIFPVILYLLGCGGTLLLFAIRYLKMRSVTRSAVLMRPGRLKIYVHKGPSGSFSLFRRIYLDRHTWEKRTGPVIRHEAAHASLHHTLDILFFSLACGILWFNPFIYLYERSLKAVHEFEADQQMLDSGRNIITYQRLLLNQVFNTSIFTLQNGFSGPSLIKKRMIMMTKKRSKRTSGFKLLLALPFIFMIVGYLSCTSEEIASPETTVETEKDDIVMFNFTEEKDANKPADTEGQKTDPQLKSGQAEEATFIVVEEMPTFNGGDVNYFREWVQKNVEYPKIAVENGIQGKVFVSFVVDKEGNVSDIGILRGVDPCLDDEVIKVVQSSPVWKPGKQRGAEVNVRFSITVNFQLQ